MKSSISLEFFASLALLPMVNGHGYMFEPPTRNSYAHSDGLVWGTAAGVPNKEYCQHCLNSNAGVCGISESGTDFDAWLDSQGNPMPWITQRTYEPGQVIEVHSHLASNHAGHMELRGCPDGKDATEECFSQHVFHFVEDMAYHLPADPAHPERGYYWGGQQANGADFAMKFRIPTSLSGARVLLQWRYITANTCSPPGYANYFSGQNSLGEQLPDEFWSPLVSECSPPYPLDGTRSNVWPEQFVNCAEVSILGNVEEPTSPSPVSRAPTKAPVVLVEPTDQPNHQPFPVPSQPPQMDNDPADGPYNGDESCCSQDFKTCANWCADSQEVCESCPQGLMVWLPEGPVNDSSCLARWSTCTNNQNGCCSGLICRGDQYYMQCQHPNEGGIITDPEEPTGAPVSHVTPSPVTDEPTGAPVSHVTPSPVTDEPASPSNHVGDDDSRLVAFLGNWQSCPSDAQISPYTHIIISFAVTYDWPVSNFEACQIRTNVPTCGNANRQDLVDHWRSLGIKVLLSFGGANMGGTWMGSGGNQPWDACYGKEEYVVQQLHDIVVAQNFDGVDIDYEYFYDTPARQNFLTKITQGLKVGLGSAPKLPVGQDEVSHAPMEDAMRPGQAYYDILVNNAMHVDFLMPQYYNAYTYPARDGLTAVGTGGYSALSHYTDMVNGIFAGDATSVVFGFCVSQCGDFNADGMQAASVMSELATYYPCNGGAFFWVADDDLDSSWSNSVSVEIEETAGCSTGPVAPSTAPFPVVPPTPSPFTEVPPTPSPISDGNDGEICGEEWASCFNNHDFCCEDHYCDVSTVGSHYAHCRRSPNACVLEWAPCNDNPDGCCDGLECKGDGWRTCQKQQEGAKIILWGD